VLGRPKTKQLSVESEPNIRLGNDGKYWWEVKKTLEDGSRFRRAGACKDLEKAVSKRDAALLEHAGLLEGAKLSAKNGLTVGDWASKCLDEIWPEELSERTLIGYSDIIRLHVKPNIGDVKLSWLDYDRINGLMTKLKADGKSAQTRRNVRNCISKLYTTAQRLGKVATGSNPAKLVLIKAEIKRDTSGNKLSHKRTLTTFECVRLLDKAKGTQYEGAVMLGLYAGLRISEVVGLRWRNVDLEKGWLSVTEQRQAIRKKGVVVSDPKSAAGVRRIPLAAPLKSWLEGRKKGEYVVTNRKGKAATSDMVSVSFKALSKAAELTGNVDENGVALADPTMHDLRHTFCYFMANGWTKPDGTRTPSVPITTLCKLAGHATIEVTAGYYVGTEDGDLIEAMANVTPPVAAQCKR